MEVGGSRTEIPPKRRKTTVHASDEDPTVILLQTLMPATALVGLALQQFVGAQLGQRSARVSVKPDMPVVKSRKPKERFVSILLCDVGKLS
jgi:hypothetical protein